MATPPVIFGLYACLVDLNFLFWKDTFEKVYDTLSFKRLVRNWIMHNSAFKS